MKGIGISLFQNTSVHKINFACHCLPYCLQSILLLLLRRLHIHHILRKKSSMALSQRFRWWHTS